jgi:hypothetical protein
MKKTAEPKFLEDTVRSAGNWAQRTFSNPAAPGASNWGNAAGEFWRNHGGKIMGGLAGAGGTLAASKLLGAKNGHAALAALLGGGAGALGGQFYDDPAWLSKLMPAQTKTATDVGVEIPLKKKPRSTPLSRNVGPGGRIDNNAKTRKTAATLEFPMPDIDTLLANLVKTAGDIGAIVGLAREKDPWEDRRDAMVRSAGTGGFTGVGAGLGGVLGGLGGTAVEALINKLTGRSGGEPEVGIGTAIGAGLGAAGGGFGGYMLARRRPEEAKARLIAKLKEDPGLLSRGVPKATISAARAEQKKTASTPDEEITVTILADIASASLNKTAGDIDWQKLWADHKGKIIGGLGGAALGGLGGAMLPSGEGDDDHTVRNGGLGALAGLAAGLGGGYLYDNPDAVAKLKSLVGIKPERSVASRVGGGAIGAGVGGGLGFLANKGLRRLSTRGDIDPLAGVSRGGGKFGALGKALRYGLPAAGAAAGGYVGAR